jgi:hypothetical protein
MAKKSNPETVEVISLEETVVTINSIAYAIPKLEPIEVPLAVAEQLAEAGYLGDPTAGA